MPLVKDTNLLKAFCVYGKLKIMFTYSSILNIKSRKQEIAKRLGISENTFRKYLSILKSKMLVYEDENGTLKLTGRYSIYEALGVTPHYSEVKNKITDKRYRLYMKELNPDNIRLLALQHKRNEINYCNIERIKNSLVKSSGNIYCPGIELKVRKQSALKAKRILAKEQSNFAGGFTNNSKYGFTDDNLSGQSIAKIIGRKSKATGNRFMHRLKSKGIITYIPRQIDLMQLTCFTNISAIQESNKLPVMIKKDKQGRNILSLRVPHAWTII